MARVSFSSVFEYAINFAPSDQPVLGGYNFLDDYSGSSQLDFSVATQAVDTVV